MASNPLFGVDIAAIVASAIGPGVLDATLNVITAGTRDVNNLTSSTQPTTTSYACKGFMDSKDRKERSGQLVDNGDVIIMLIGNTISAGAIVPKLGDTVTIESRTYRIGGLDRDPAAATYELLCSLL